MKIIIIASVSSNRVIGRNGQIPWELPEDLQHFKTTTMGHTLLMGRKTFESIGGILPGRTNIVVSNTISKSQKNSELHIVENPSKGLELARSISRDKLFICGGESIYNYFMEIADELLITEINSIVEGDTFFPDISMESWKKAETGFIGESKLKRYVRSSHKNLLS